MLISLAWPFRGRADSHRAEPARIYRRRLGGVTGRSLSPGLGRGHTRRCGPGRGESKAHPGEARGALAARRFRHLNGRPVCLLDSTKHNSARLLDAIGELLQERYAVKEIVRERKPYFGRPVPIAQAQKLASRCDVVITAVGD